jgi:enterochelin esterase-like enzyme
MNAVRVEVWPRVSEISRLAVSSSKCNWGESTGVVLDEVEGARWKEEFYWGLSSSGSFFSFQKTLHLDLETANPRILILPSSCPCRYPFLFPNLSALSR